MPRMWPKKVSGMFAGLAFAGLSFAAVPAHPGMVNYLEGQASINGAPIDVKQVGTLDVQPGQQLETGSGKAEVLLTPGVLLRVGDHSVLRLETAGLTDTRVELVKGEAMVEANQVMKESAIRIDEDGASTRIEKEGLYRFNADQAKVSVIDGKAEVTEGDQHVDLKKGREVALALPLKTNKFDRKDEDPLYAWSNVRSQQLSNASLASARIVVNNYGGGWGGWGGGWFWNPGFGYYSYLPGDGMFFSPFGYGFYSPAYIYRNPVIVTGGSARAFYRGGASSYVAPRSAFAGRSISGGSAGFSHMSAMRSTGGGFRR